MWRAIGALAGAVLLFTVLPSAARAQAANGQIAALVDDRLVTLNPDGSGLRPIFNPARPEEVTGLAWAPDGNRLAFAASGRILLFDLATRRITMLTNPLEDVVDTDPGWSLDGQRIVFRRVELEPRRQVAMSITRTGSNPIVLPYEFHPETTGVAWHPLEEGATEVVDNLLALPELEDPPTVTGAPAWAPDGALIAYANAGGLHTIDAATLKATPVTSAPAGPPRWSPNGATLIYATGAELRSVPVNGGQPRVVFNASTRAAAPDWQPCIDGTTVNCESIAPPKCASTPVSVTTQTDQAVELPPPPCSDPAGRPLAATLVKAPDHGVLSGWRFTPSPGYVGQDSVAYRMSNGDAESELVRVTIFVVPRLLATPAGPRARAPQQLLRAPHLIALGPPRLNARRQTVVRLRCDQDCSFAVRLAGQLRSPKRRLKGPLVRRAVVSRGVVTVRLRLARRPKGKLRNVWIVGSVRNATGVRSVKVPVRVRR